jgi:hypothetical protein
MRDDPTIQTLWFVAAIMQFILFFLAKWVVGQFMLDPPLLACGILFIALGMPVGIVFAGCFITPRVRRALESPSKADSRTHS